MKKETAVDWLIDAIRNQIAEGTLNAISISELKMLAKIKEKEQIESAYTKGRIDEITTMDDLYFNPSWEKYYNETYK